MKKGALISSINFTDPSPFSNEQNLGSSVLFSGDTISSINTAQTDSQSAAVRKLLQEFLKAQKKIQVDQTIISSRLSHQEKVLGSITTELDKAEKKAEELELKFKDENFKQDQEKVRLIEMLSVFVGMITFVGSSISIFGTDMSIEKIFMILTGIAVSLIVFSFAIVSLLRQYWIGIVIIIVVLVAGFVTLYFDIKSKDESKSAQKQVNELVITGTPSPNIGKK